MQTAVIPEQEVKRVSYVDPTGYPHIVDRQLSNRLENIKGKVAGLLDNSNDTSRSFFISLADVLQNEYGVSKVILRSKFDHSKAAPTEMFREVVQEADFLVAGVAL